MTRRCEYRLVCQRPGCRLAAFMRLVLLSPPRWYNPVCEELSRHMAGLEALHMPGHADDVPKRPEERPTERVLWQSQADFDGTGRQPRALPAGTCRPGRP